MATTKELLEIFKSKMAELGDRVRERTGRTDKMSIDEMIEEIEWIDNPEVPSPTYILVDELGNEIPAVLTDEIIPITATSNDIRLGVTAITDAGIIEGTKEIPSYVTTEGFRFIPNGSAFSLYLSNGSYAYTKLQAIFCEFNTNKTDSVSADRVVINDNVYPVMSTVSESTVTVDNDKKIINFGLTNTFGTPYIVRYFTYKEVY